MRASKLVRDLTEFLRVRDPDGRRCVPVLGSGVNIQAAAIEGRSGEDDWIQLIAKVARRIRVTRRALESFPASPLGRWEHLLRLWAKRKGVDPYKAETELQKIVCHELREQEARSSEFRLYSEFLAAGYRDIISLNFDRRIALGDGRERFSLSPKPSPLGGAGETLYRHSIVEGVGATSTRVWYPHGDTKKYSTLKLGVRKYGFQLGLLEEYRGSVGSEWRKRHLWTESLPSAERSPDIGAPTWVGAFLCRPLVFIGCGLDPDEWSLWWLLRQRASDVPEGPVPAPIFFLTVEGSMDDNTHLWQLATLPGVSIVCFPSYEQLWTRVREALA